MTDEEPTELLGAALVWHELGYSTLPVADDLTKRPAVMWKRYQSERADVDVLTAWFTNPRHGLGIVTGAVSGQLELFEFEGRAVAEGLVDAMRVAMEDHGQSELWAQLGGYVELTPSGGLHLYYRVDGPARGNTKLARRPSTEAELAEHPMAKVQVLIETRGEGGYGVVAPTPGWFHATGRPWSIMRGSPATIPTITVEQRDTLHAIASTLDALPVAETPVAVEPPEPAADGTVSTGTGVRPGDDYNAKAQWADILDGWTRMRRIGGGWGWQRPGKNDRSISATTGTSSDGADRLYVFSSSTEFDTERPYSKFAAYAHLHHNGDYTAAAKELKRTGFGESTPPPVISATPTPPRSTSLFNAAAAPQPAPEHAPAPAPALTLVDTPTGSLFDANTALAPQLATYPRHTDAGNGVALVNLHGERLRFDCDRGRWLVFRGHQWHLQPPKGGEVRELAKDSARHMPVGDDDKAARTWQSRSLTSVGVTATLTSTETIPGISIHTNELDTDPYLLGTPGGVVELRTGQLRPGRPEDLISRATTVTPEFGPVPQLWTDFLNTTFSADQDRIDYIRRIFGLAVIGEVREHILPLFYGPLGHNGKSTLIDIALHILGISDQGYATSVPSEILMVRKHEAHSTELAQMAGRRLIVASELEDGQRLAEARIKLITGRDVISARFLYGQPFSFNPSHQIIMVGNNKPRATTGGPALWRRLASVPFDHQVPPEDRDPELPDKLIAIGGHILGWMIGGGLDYLNNGGLRTPKSVLDATEEYQHGEDSLGRFVEERIHVGGPTTPAKIAVMTFREAYEKWCGESGDIPLSPKRINLELDTRFGVKSFRGTGGTRFFQGVTLLADESDTDPDPRRAGDWYDR